jgi:hypothetical protein
VAPSALRSARRILAIGGAPAFVLAGALVAGTAACSSGSPGAQTAPNAPAQTAAGALNPDGIPYPTVPAGYGHAARRGNTAGSVIQNFKFLGYPNADGSKGLQSIALSDYYDPCGRRLKLLHLSVAAVWCTPCKEETAAFVAAKATLDSEQVVVLQALSDGPTMNVGATEADLQFWIKQNKPTFTEMLDPNLANLGVFFDAAAVPWNADIDPRTMEIIDDQTGYAGTVDLEIKPGITAVAQAPRYPIPAACN